jgi:hypothetical protein
MTAEEEWRQSFDNDLTFGLNSLLVSIQRDI